MGPEDRLTDLARELAQRRGVKLVDAAQAAARTAAAPQPAPRPAPAAPQPASVSRPAPAAPLRPQAAGGGGEEYDLVILGGTCVLPEMGCLPLNVCVRGGKIAALTAEVPRGRRVIDASGLYVLPGIIDPHTHLGLAVPFGQELESETAPPSSGAVTTIGTYFNQPGQLSAGRSTACAGTVSHAVPGRDMIPHLLPRGSSSRSTSCPCIPARA